MSTFTFVTLSIFYSDTFTKVMFSVLTITIYVLLLRFPLHSLTYGDMVNEKCDFSHFDFEICLFSYICMYKLLILQYICFSYISSARYIYKCSLLVFVLWIISSSGCLFVGDDLILLLLMSMISSFPP